MVQLQYLNNITSVEERFVSEEWTEEN